MVCPGCGANRLKPLSLPVYQREAGDPMHPEVRWTRPVARCAACGQRIFARIAARSRLPIDIEFD
jgi:hypothetical protein